MRVKANIFLCFSTAHAFVVQHPTQNRIHRNRGNQVVRQLSPSDIKDTVTGLVKFDSLIDVLSGVKTSLDGVIGGLDALNSLIDSNYENSLKSVLGELKDIFNQEQELQAEFSKYATKLSNEIDQWLLTQNPTVESLYKQV